MTWTAESFSASEGPFMCHVYKIGHRWHWRVYDMRTARGVGEGMRGSLNEAQQDVENLRGKLK